MAGFNRETSMGEDVERKLCILGYLMKCERKVVGRCQKKQKENQYWHYKKKKMRNEKKTKCKSMKDYSKAENECEEVGQHVLLAKVFF